MDDRGLTIDPNRDIYEELQWWEQIGPTQRPSPYATASWTYWHDLDTESLIVGPDALVRHHFCSVKVYDGHASDPAPGLDDDYSENRGHLLGEINYEILGSLLTITDWSHYNWHDATPVKRAFKVLIKDVPDCVETIMVKDSPTAFWVHLGFRYVDKGDNMLVYDNRSHNVVPY